MNLVIFLIAHFLGDFIFQPNILVDLKSVKIRYQVLHSLIYAVLFMIVLSFFLSILYTLLGTLLIFGLHFVIDWLRVKSDKENASNGFRFLSFILDQITHIVFIILITIGVNAFSDNPYVFLDGTLELFTNIDTYHLALVVLSYIIILSPTSVLIKHFFRFFFKKVELNPLNGEETREANIGSLIGKLERILILTLGLMGLYSSIAIVLAAKSLARFKQLEDKEFAERYLVGTLISLIVAILCIASINVFGFNR